MNYKHLIDAIKKYGSTDEDICLHGTGVRPDQINENVILAPWWEPDILQDLGDTEFLSESPSASIKVWNIKNNSLNITYIKTGIGAPVLMDTLLSLGVTKCRRAIFIGSVGSLDPQINIGDLVIPEYSICGDGASRYITADTLTHTDPFGEKQYPDPHLQNTLCKHARHICQTNNVPLHKGRTFSIDTIFAPIRPTSKK